MIQIDYPKSLHKLRRTLNVSQQQLANILNVSFSSVNQCYFYYLANEYIHL
jgi:predicted transcriptional regulator